MFLSSGSRGAAICGEANSPAIYTRIKAFLPWIEGTLNRAQGSSCGANAASVGLLLFVRVLDIVHALGR